MSRMSARVVLFGEADPGTTVAGSPTWQRALQGMTGVLAVLSPGGQATLYGELARSIGNLLNIDVLEVMVGGWRRHRALVAAAEATRDRPGATEVVDLAAHRIGTTHRPYLDIVVDGAKVATVHFDLSIELTVDALRATVRQTRPVAVQGGRTTVAVGLGCEGIAVAAGHVTLDPHVSLPLGEGIPLLAQQGAGVR